jgi:hypothetical protein
MRERLWMPTTALALPLAMALGLLGCSKPTETSGPPPQIACDAPVHDFGTISQGADAVHTFVIKNQGQGTLKIERAKGS